MCALFITPIVPNHSGVFIDLLYVHPLQPEAAVADE